MNLSLLLHTMLYPNGTGTKFSFQDKTPEFLSSLVGNANFEKLHSGENKSIDSRDFGVGGLEFGRIFGKIAPLKHRGLRAGALLYALYWISKKPEDKKYATIHFAARMVMPPTEKYTAEYQSILSDQREFAAVAHFWAAFILVIFPDGGYEGIIEEPAEFTDGEDSLYTFLEKVHVPTFLGYAAQFRQFAQSYRHPKQNVRTLFSASGIYHWKTYVPFDESNMVSPEIPNIWTQDYPFDKIKSLFDKKTEESRQDRKVDYDQNYSAKQTLSSK